MKLLRQVYKTNIFNAKLQPKVTAFYYSNQYEYFPIYTANPIKTNCSKVPSCPTRTKMHENKVIDIIDITIEIIKDIIFLFIIC